MFSDQEWNQYEVGDGFLAFLAACPYAADFVLSTLHTFQCAMLGSAAMQSAACATVQVQEQCVLEVLVSLLYITFYDLRETWWVLLLFSKNKNASYFPTSTARKQQINIYLDCIMLDCLIFRLLFKLPT